MTKDVKIDFWDCSEDSDSLFHDCMDEAIQDHLNDALGDENAKDLLDSTLTVYGFTKVKPTADTYADRVLWNLLETIDDDYGSPHGDVADATQAMVVAAKEFCEKVVKEYDSWACAVVKKVEVNVREWLEANDTDLLREVEGTDD